MSKIIRRPSQDLGNFFGRGVDDLIEGIFKPVRAFSSGWSENLPALDIVEHDKKYVITAEMPGMEKEDINVSYDNGVITISGEKKEETEEKQEGKLIRQELSYGKYLRQFSLGQEVDENAITANYKNGVLTLTVPKAEESTPEKVKIEIL